MIIKNNVQLQPHNSLRTKALSKIFCEPQTASELSEIIRAYGDERKLVLGKGFNLFFTEDFDGLVIKPAMQGIRHLSESDRFVEMEVGAAEDWDRFVAYCVDHGYHGIENLSLIPGSMGDAPVQKIEAPGTQAIVISSSLAP